MSDTISDLRRILDDAETYKKALEVKDARIASLEERLRHAKQWHLRLEEKIAALEDTDACLDGWDAEYLAKNQCEVRFVWKADGTFRAVVTPKGRKGFIEINATPGVALRDAIWRASGRKRTEPQSETPESI